MNATRQDIAEMYDALTAAGICHRKLTASPLFDGMLVRLPADYTAADFVRAATHLNKALGGALDLSRPWKLFA